MCAAKADDSLAVRPLLIGLPGPVLDAATREMIARLQPAGFILFARNCESPAQLQNLTSALADLSVLPQPLILIDHEGGRVTRFQWDDSRPQRRFLVSYGGKIQSKQYGQHSSMGCCLVGRWRSMG